MTEDGLAGSCGKGGFFGLGAPIRICRAGRGKILPPLAMDNYGRNPYTQIEGIRHACPVFPFAGFIGIVSSEPFPQEPWLLRTRIHPAEPFRKVPASRLECTLRIGSVWNLERT